MGRVADVCNSIVTLLNAGPLSGQTTAIRKNVWIEKIEAGNDLKCTVYPTEIETTASTRGAVLRRLRVGVTLVKRLENQNAAARLAEEDGLIDLSEAIETALYGVAHADMRFVDFNETIGSRTIIDPEEAATRGVFRTLTELTYLGT